MFLLVDVQATGLSGHEFMTQLHRTDDLFAQLAVGRIKAHVGQKMALSAAAEAHRVLAGRRTGRDGFAAVMGCRNGLVPAMVRGSRGEYRPEVRRPRAIACGALALLAVFATTNPAEAASVLSVGPRAVQTLVTEQLFNRGGRWYLIDDGGVCYTYLESPHARVVLDRLVLNAHLSSRLGQRIGNSCAGADFTSNVTLSGKLHGTEHNLTVDDIRIDRVDDEATRNALDLALQLAPQSMPRSASIDILELVRKQALSPAASAVHVDQFRILNIATRTDAVIIQFELSLSAP
jgi:hypothetical protein